MASEDGRLETSKGASQSEEGLQPQPLPGSDIQDEQAFMYSESQKLGVAGSAFLIINKMIGTGGELDTDGRY